MAEGLLASMSDYARELASREPYGPRDRLGSLNLVDEAARLRGASVITLGQSFSLGRPLEGGVSGRVDDKPMYALELFQTPWGDFTMGSDHVELDCHGQGNTHLDALNHVGFDGCFYAGWQLADADAPSIADVADRGGLFTRAVVADIPRARGTEWVTPEHPVSADDIQKAVDLTGTTIQSGDALLLYMGRDTFEAAGNRYDGMDEAGSPSPGVGRSGAEWLAEQPIALLGWDFLDAGHHDEPEVSVHFLVWALGLAILDAVDFSRAIPGLRAAGRSVGALALNPLNMAGATGSNVNPILLI